MPLSHNSTDWENYTSLQLNDSKAFFLLQPTITTKTHIIMFLQYKTTTKSVYPERDGHIKSNIWLKNIIIMTLLGPSTKLSVTEDKSSRNKINKLTQCMSPLPTIKWRNIQFQLLNEEIFNSNRRNISFYNTWNFNVNIAWYG